MFRSSSNSGMTVYVAASNDTTGVTDTTNIQAAITAIAASSDAKGAVVLSGNYYLKASVNASSSYAAINLATGVDIIGTNRAKVKLMASTQASGYGGMCFFGVSVSNIVIKDIEIDGNRTGFTSPAFGGAAQDGIVGSGVYLRSCADVSVTRCWSHSNIYHGVLAVQNCNRVHIDYNKFSDNGYRAAHFNSDDAGVLQNCSMNYNDVFANGAAADNTTNGGLFPALGPCYRIECIGNNVASEPFIGISMTGTNGGSLIAREVICTNNILVACTTGIQTANGLLDSIISNNDMSACVTAGFIAGQSLNCKYNGNTIRRTVGGGTTGGYGFVVGATSSDNLTGCSFDNNHVIDCQGNTSTRTAVYVNTGAHKACSINGNHLINNGVTDANTCGGIALGDPSTNRSSSLSICGNHLIGNKGHGIVVYDTDNCLISHNQLQDNYEATGPRGTGIYVRGTADGTIVSHNTVLNDNVSNNQNQYQADGTTTNTSVLFNYMESTTTNVYAPTASATGVYFGNTTNGRMAWVSTMTPAMGLVTTTKASGAAVSLASPTAATVVSITLDPGTYDVSAQCEFVLAGATSTLHQIGISATAATLPTQAGGSGIGTDPLTTFPIPTTTLTNTLSLGIPPVQVTLTAQTIIYLVAAATFSVGTETVYGTLRARRIG